MESHSDFYKSLKDSDNGYFTVESRSGRAFLCVYPPGKKGRPVAYSDVIARLDLFKLSGYDLSFVREIVVASEGRSHDICEWEDRDSSDASSEIQISEDLMEAKMILHPPRGEGKFLSEEEITAQIEKSGIVFGIIDEAIKKISSSPPLAVFEIVIARGSPAKKGKNAYIKHYFSVNPRAVPEVDPGNSDRVDFRKLNVIQSSEKDQILAEIIPGLPGEEGVNIKGEVDETPGPVHAKLTAGRNVRSSDGETKLYAEIAGHVRIFHDEEKNLSRIDVEEILVLDDVDYSTGHIDFPGTVIVHGTVLDGFEVKARGDIIIDKSIGNVRLSSEGEIVLSGGIVGRGSALVTAESDVFSRYVQDAGIHTHGSIHIEESAINSRLTSGGKIVISEGRGELIGGETLCAEYLKVKKLGARMETPTRIIAGLDPDTVNSLRSLEEDFLDKKNTLSKILTHISQIDEFRKKNPEGAKKEEDTYKKLEVLKEKYEAMVKNISDQMTKIGSSVKPAESSFVEVLESIYPGVEVSFGAGIKNYRVENRPVHQYSRFLIEDGRIILRHS